MIFNLFFNLWIFVLDFDKYISKPIICLNKLYCVYWLLNLYQNLVSMSSQKWTRSRWIAKCNIPNDPRRQFVSNEEAKWFGNFDKPWISEHGFDFSTQLIYDPIITRLDHVQWNTFCRQPFKSTTILIIQEFYASFPESEDNKVFMRGVYVDVALIVIEVVHKTPRYSFDFYDQLTQGQGNWVQKSVTQEPLWYQQSIMTLETKMWIYFICANFFPAQHVTVVTGDHALLLYAILQGRKINVGD